MKTLYDSVETNTLEQRLNALENSIKSLQGSQKEEQKANKVCIICFSGEWDRLFAVLSIAGGSLAMGMEVNLFFTFWAVSALRNGKSHSSNGRSLLQGMFAKMLPAGFDGAQLSKFNFGGLGKVMLKRVMKSKGLDDVDTLFQEVIDMGVNIYLCDNTSEIFGLDSNELQVGEEMKRCGVATFLAEATQSKVVLFI